MKAALVRRERAPAVDPAVALAAGRGPVWFVDVHLGRESRAVDDRLNLGGDHLSGLVELVEADVRVCELDACRGSSVLEDGVEHAADVDDGHEIYDLECSYGEKTPL